MSLEGPSGVNGATLLGALGLLLVASVTLGAYPVPLLHVVGAFWPGHAPAGLAPTETEMVVLRLVRAPRVLEAALAGAGLGLAGAAMQGLFRNPLIGPDLVGVAPGASTGAALAILSGWPAWGLSISAWCGALLALAATLGFARLGRQGGVMAFVLAGVIVSSFFGALLGLAEYLADPDRKLPDLVYWLLGSFAAASGSKVSIVATTLLLGGLPLLLLRWRVNLLSLNEDDVRALGVQLGAFRTLVVVAAALVVAGQVAVSGVIGWIGLIAPHAARALVGPDHRRLLPAAALVGAISTLAVDDVARTLTTQEIPIGLLTALIGTPVFGVLFWRFQARGWSGD